MNQTDRRLLELVLAVQQGLFPRDQLVEACRDLLVGEPETTRRLVPTGVDAEKWQQLEKLVDRLIG